MEAALKFSVEGYLKDHNSTLEYVEKKMKKKFPNYTWHVISGEPITYMNKHVTINVEFYNEDYSLSIFGNQK